MPTIEHFLWHFIKLTKTQTIYWPFDLEIQTQ